ncbi:MAG: anti-sigma factor family protein, partial [Anaerolineales bacterium]
MISEQDFDRLSAYLDHQLPASEKLALEARLVKDPALKAALRDMRLQARALRDLPKVKAPRNFT